MSDVADKLMQQAVQARKEKRLADAKRDWAEAVELCRLEGMKRDLVAALKGLVRSSGTWAMAMRRYRSMKKRLLLPRGSGTSCTRAHGSASR